mgnify:CR=1 FL=1
MTCLDQTREFAPQLSLGNPNITAPDLTEPTLVQSSTITLTYPYTSPTNTLVLRAPELNNVEALKITRVLNKTRGGDLNLFRAPFWLQIYSLSYKINSLTQQQAYDFLDFIQESLGKDIGLLDYESRQWQGLIVNPNKLIAQLKRNCSYSAELEFQGSLV